MQYPIGCPVEKALPAQVKETRGVVSGRDTMNTIVEIRRGPPQQQYLHMFRTINMNERVPRGQLAAHHLHNQYSRGLWKSHRVHSSNSALSTEFSQHYCCDNADARTIRSKIVTEFVNANELLAIFDWKTRFIVQSVRCHQ